MRAQDGHELWRSIGVLYGGVQAVAGKESEQVVAHSLVRSNGARRLVEDCNRV